MEVRGALVPPVCARCRGRVHALGLPRRAHPDRPVAARGSAACPDRTDRAGAGRRSAVPARRSRGAVIGSTAEIGACRFAIGGLVPLGDILEVIRPPTGRLVLVWTPSGTSVVRACSPPGIKWAGLPNVRQSARRPLRARCVGRSLAGYPCSCHVCARPRGANGQWRFVILAIFSARNSWSGPAVMIRLAADPRTLSAEPRRPRRSCA